MHSLDYGIRLYFSTVRMYGRSMPSNKSSFRDVPNPSFLILGQLLDVHVRLLAAGLSVAQQAPGAMLAAISPTTLLHTARVEPKGPLDMLTSSPTEQDGNGSGAEQVQRDPHPCCMWPQRN
jgi:hypothetical protein